MSLQLTAPPVDHGSMVATGQTESAPITERKTPNERDLCATSDGEVPRLHKPGVTRSSRVLATLPGSCHPSGGGEPATAEAIATLLPSAQAAEVGDAESNPAHFHQRGFSREALIPRDRHEAKACAGGHTFSCSDWSPCYGFRCTLPVAHAGDHVAGELRGIYARWAQVGEVVRPRLEALERQHLEAERDELLAALRETIEQLAALLDDTDFGQWGIVERARAAIAKAEGGAS